MNWNKGCEARKYDVEHREETLQRLVFIITTISSRLSVWSQKSAAASIELALECYHFSNMVEAETWWSELSSLLK